MQRDPRGSRSEPVVCLIRLRNLRLIVGIRDEVVPTRRERRRDVDRSGARLGRARRDAIAERAGRLREDRRSAVRRCRGVVER